MTSLSDTPLNWKNILTKEWVRELRKEMQQILDETDLSRTFDIQVGNASLDTSEVVFKLKLQLKGAETREQRDLNTFSQMDNVDPSKVGELRGEKYSLIGYNRKARARPYIVQNLNNNKEYIFTTDMAQRYFGMEK